MDNIIGMSRQDNLDFARIAQAIEYIRDNFKRRPSLDEIAAQVALSPSRFQRLFTEWAGVSPKKFSQYISVEYAKSILDRERLPLEDVAGLTGLSGTGRLHDMFVSIEAMTPGEYKNGGSGLVISYNFGHSPFGPALIASTPKGICHISFVDDEQDALDVLTAKFPNATYVCRESPLCHSVLSAFSSDWSGPEQARLHLKGTPFQLKVWDALLKIPQGGLTTYGELASSVGRPKASRAVGTAVGDNPVALLIPCHRVIRSSGELGGYRWGLARKAAVIGWEAARQDRK